MLDLENEDWKDAYENLTPPGKIADILESTATTRNRLRQFERPAWERDPLPVYLMTENTNSVADLVDELKKYDSPLFLNGKHLPPGGELGSFIHGECGVPRETGPPKEICPDQ